MLIDTSTMKFGVPVVQTEELTDLVHLTECLGLQPVAPMTARVESERKEGGVCVKISVEGIVNARCDLCGEWTTAPCKCSFTEELTEEDEAFDPVTGRYSLDELIDECVVMSSPREVRCKSDCKGLCPRCGRNLNVETCTCGTTTQAEGNPFAVLQDIFLTGGAKNGSTKK